MSLDLVTCRVGPISEVKQYLSDKDERKVAVRDKVISEHWETVEHGVFI